MRCLVIVTVLAGCSSCWLTADPNGCDPTSCSLGVNFSHAHFFNVWLMSHIANFLSRDAPYRGLHSVSCFVAAGAVEFGSIRSERPPFHLLSYFYRVAGIWLHLPRHTSIVAIMWTADRHFIRKSPNPVLSFGPAL